MMAVFVTALLVGVGALALQIVGGHDGDADAGHDVGHDSPFFVLASLRFWAFALLTFGLVGTLLRLFHFAGRVESAVIASVAGAVAGFVAASIVRRLQTRTTSSVITGDEVVGHVGRVLVAPTASARGKVRVAIRGSVVDYVAHSDEALAEDEAVLVEAVEAGEVRVSRAPKELAPKE